MSKFKKPAKLDYSDRISDLIVDMFNSEMQRKDFSPIHFYAGVLLALMAMHRSAESIKYSAPPEFLDLDDAVSKCLHSLITSAAGG